MRSLVRLDNTHVSLVISQKNQTRPSCWTWANVQEWRATRKLGPRGSSQQTNHQARPWSGSRVSAGDKPRLLPRKQKALGWLGCRNKCGVKDSVNTPKYLQPEEGTFPPRLENASSAGPPSPTQNCSQNGNFNLHLDVLFGFFLVFFSTS